MASKNTSKDDYILGRHYAATSRLNLQHFLWKDVFGYLLHPTIKCESGDALKIADVGTGTGQWLFDLTKELPSTCELQGLDVDFGQAPPQQWCPRNVSLRQWDALEEPPADMVSRFDVVQVRLFIFVIKDNDPSMLLRNVLKLLKPGGYLQWGEPDFETLRMVKSNPSNPSESLERLFNATRSQDRRLQPTWVKDLPVLFKSHGLVDVVEDRRVGPQHNWFAFNKCNMMVYDEILERGDIPDDRIEDLRNLLVRASQECRAGVANVTERVHIVGMKPQNL